MHLSFIKMTGLGNDYIFFNALDNPNLTQLIQPNIPFLSNRHFGIGGDGVIIIEPSSLCDCKMRMFNDDGSEAAMCGNGIRQLAKLVWDKHLIKKNPLTVETLAGERVIHMTMDKFNMMKSASVNMGYLDFNPDHIPFYPEKKLTINNIPVFYEEFQEKQICFYTGSIGTSHAACFLEENVESIEFFSLGRKIEQNLKLFPNRVNVEFVNIISPSCIKIRVWERGSGHTLACGTGAAFTAGLALELGLITISQNIEVQMEAGTLHITKNEDSTFSIEGDAGLVFEGSITL